MDKLEQLRRMIESDCAINKYPNRSYSDYDKGREAGYNWILKEINKLQESCVDIIEPMPEEFECKKGDLE